MKLAPRTKKIALASLLVLSAGATWAWLAHRAPAPAGELVLHGNVDIRQVSLAFEGSGRIAALHVDEGDRVKAGALLGTLDTRTLALHAEQAAAQAEVQRQALARLRNGLRPQEIAQARSRLKAAQANALRAGQDLARLQEIAASTGGRGVSAQDLDRARSAAEVAAAQADEQRQALGLAELGARKEDVAAAEAQLKASEAQLALLRHQVAQGELRAPVDALVRSRLAEPGDMAAPQRPVFALALARPKWIRVYVGETDLGRVRPGMAARVLTDSHPGRPVAGKVGYISSVAEFTPKAVQTEELRTSLVYEVRVMVEDEQELLRLGQPATVRLDAGTPR
ncbi:HlyD family efflux transporter periplasmic adaptor subunit [Massilia sp. ST3]|uniref:HlyD family efflux transporter periplasmic adaptor subunit n=1 Tax=Massilia sp. ST3 TaxID=2824903 RepID=UPI001B825195|nr:HlyD family efflux transporter periplasmic adaptor subunit [Massilia sp. ST3]MBQ5947978.1 HlyD family efflux transporter periplasmic adaptor subunit [Massilia sp. ST3]